MTALDLFKGSRGSHSTTSIMHTEGTVYEYQVRYGGRIHHIVKHRLLSQITATRVIKMKWAEDTD